MHPSPCWKRRSSAPRTDQGVTFGLFTFYQHNGVGNGTFADCLHKVLSSRVPLVEILSDHVYYNAFCNYSPLLLLFFGLIFRVPLLKESDNCQRDCAASILNAAASLVKRKHSQCVVRKPVSHICDRQRVHLHMLAGYLVICSNVNVKCLKHIIVQ